MSLRKVLLAATVLALPVAAQAQPINGLYIGAAAGANWVMDSDVTVSGISPAFGLTSAQRTGTVSYDLGYALVGNIGYGFGNGIRAELEVSFRENDVDSVSGFRGGRRSSGLVQTFAIMGNAYYDFNFAPNQLVTPYVGVGAGYGFFRASNVRQISTTDFRDQTTASGTDGRFAYQAIVGAAFNVPGAPGLALTAEYRFFATLDQEVDSTVYRPAGFARGKAEFENYNHSLLLGIRYAFGQTPPPPVVAPAPAPAAAPQVARTYLVFFDWNRADLTDRARQIIGEAAQNAQSGGVTRIEVSGHADRSGTPQYNQRLSERRAQVVAAELERRGIARSAMSIQAFGESRPLVPTADGVREPQNRRVEIVFR
jgi:OOP family OmpA-OmpF porin